MTDALLMLRDLVARIAGRAASESPAVRTPILATSLEWPVRLWSELASLGILAAPFSENDGGLGVQGEAAMVVMEALGRAAVFVPFVSTSVIGARLFSELDDRTSLAAIAAGEMRLAFAHAENAFELLGTRLNLTADAEDQGFRLSGRKILVKDAASATHLVVSAREASRGLSLFMLPVGTPGLQLDAYPTVDGGNAADVTFDRVQVPAASLLVKGRRAAALASTLLHDATVAVCSEAIGLMRSVLDQTAAYIKQRQQFGQPLSNFQALQHRLVEMLMEIEAAESLTLRATLHRGDGAAVSAAKVRVDRALQKICHDAVQLHGGIGTTQDLPLSKYFRRAMAIRCEYGTAPEHQKRVEMGLSKQLRAKPLANGPSLHGGKSDPEAAFRAEVAVFLDQAMTPELRAEADRQVSVFASPRLAATWHQALYRKGWAAPNWPKEYGGTGWSALQRFIFEEECARVNTPVLPAMGLQMCGPVLIGHGTPAQKHFFLPRILSGEHFWCQGYSEPTAGSDLARLKTRAAREGDDYVIEGTKIWTTYAHVANWIFMLVRTSHDARPQAGISFLLVPLSSPGITVTPIKSISGEHEVNQIFFDKVRVPVSNRVGEENHGWSVAKYLLEFERGGAIATNRTRRVIGLLKRLAVRERGLAPDLLRRLAHLESEVEATEWTQRRMLNDAEAGGSVGNANASILKLKASELYQSASLLFFDTLGGWGLAEQRDALDGNSEVRGPDFALTGAARYMNSRAMSIFGGSSEIQRGIIAKAVFGL